MQTQKLTCSINQNFMVPQNPSLTNLQPQFHPKSQQSFQLVNLRQKTIRKYQLYCENPGSFLQTAQWRSSGSNQIAKIIYVKITQQINSNAGCWVQLYTDHMELLLKDIKKLVTSQVMYFFVKILQGSCELLQKFKKVSINSQTIGLNPKGQCIVWLNRHLERFYPEYYSQSNEQSIIKTVIALLKQKGQKQSIKILSKIEEFSSKKKSTIRQVLSFCNNLMKMKGIKIPKNVEYLLKQNRIMNQLQQIEGHKTIRQNQQSKKRSTLKTLPNFHSTNLLRSRKQSIIQNEETTSDKHLRNIRQFMKRSHNQVTKKISFQKLKMKTQSSSQDKYLTKPHFQKITLSNFNSRQSFSRSRSKSKEKCIQIINKIRKYSGSQSTEKFSSRPSSIKPMKISKTSQVQTVSSMVESDKNESCVKMCKRRTYERIGKTHNSILSNFSNKSRGSIVPEQKDESYESSPNKDNILNNFQKEDLLSPNKFSFAPQNDSKQDIFLNNNWSKNINGLLSFESNVNASIVQGPQKYAYLQEVKLERLDKLNKHLVQSRTPSSQILLEEPLQ